MSDAVERKGGKLLSGGMTLLAGHGAAQFIGLIRNLAVARLVSPDDFGLAATFAATLSVLEAASNLAWDKLLIQAPNGDEDSLLATVHTLNIVRGVLVAAAIFLAAGPLAAMFDVPSAQFAFEYLALVPLLRGFAHMDMSRLQRGLRFGPEVAVSLSSAALGTLIAIILAWVLQDFRAMLYGIIAQSLAFAMGSHIVAERIYRVGYRPQHIRQVIGFGWPLLLNGLVIVATSHGDRLLIGAQSGVRDLALYAAAIMLVEALRFLLSKVFGGLALPWLSAVQDQRDEFARRYLLFAAATAVTAIVFFLPGLTLGSTIVVVLFGSDYAGPVLLAVWVAYAGGVRFLRTWTIVTAMAIGDTKNVLIVNCVRPIGIVLGYFLLEAGYDFVAVAIAICAAEILSLAVSFLRLRLQSDLPVAPVLLVICIPLILFTGTTFVYAVFEDQFGLSLRLLYTVTVLGAGTGLILLASRPFRYEIRALVTRFAQRLS